MVQPPHAPSATPSGEADAAAPTLLCFSHLRWAFVFQRPQHLIMRFARTRRTWFWEEPRRIEGLAEARLDRQTCAETGVTILTPELPAEADPTRETDMLKALLDALVATASGPLIRWYYTPMMLPFSAHVAADCVVYDCMDELANFDHAPPELLPLEERLIAQADLVFTGGYSLYEAKRDRHPAVHPFPSSVDAAHFAKARAPGAEPADQAAIPGPRLGFYGVIDERMDLALLDAVAAARPDWSLVIIGPVVKISEADLPRRPNIHYLGGKSYAALPDYLRGWDVALMPFAINAATRFISPTKTPEYLAAGRPVVSTPITDVVRHYGALEAVEIADTADAFVAACAASLARAADPGGAWRAAVADSLATLSWDRSFAAMEALIAEATARGAHVQPIVSPTAGGAPAPRHYDVMVVGAGFAGAVMAERLARESGKRVLVVDRRPHIAGNAFDHEDEAGILIHQYGPHIFHTNSAEIFDYLSRFTEWRPYAHRVLADVNGLLVPMPINRTTLNRLYGLDLDSDEAAAAFLASRAEPVEVVRSSADVVISAVGRELYETFFQGYTRKQWGMDPSELDKSVTARVPTRTNCDDRYFTDQYQAMPAKGFTHMFARMLDHPNIDLLLGVDYAEAREAYPHDHLVFTGPIDEYFGYRFGKLPYRSLRFQHETVDREWVQEVAVINHPAPDTPYTRVTEYKHLTGQSAPRSSITYEYPSAEGDPYYPIPRAENQALFKRYEALALAQADVTFVGRLATYRYYNMDQVVGQALAAHRRLAARWAAAGEARVRPAAVTAPAAAAGPAGKIEADGPLRASAA
ncbi:UDP-galactopyranose mutase [Sphingomonas morindae]|uniref:UDP-galactopyranose mutase n=1 Tax=Sphingomonas morindae TaxID=1541170 RepID=A0ABY4XDL3_9SPHN|nr:UDP-galactopyranose mutase [Sphingomonas morindae]USI74997.1 UDP-galactopyranose mutase [Sphingomonas morindae]